MALQTVTSSAQVEPRPSAHRLRVSVASITGGGMSGGYEKYLAKTLHRFVEHPDIAEIHLVFQRSLAERVLNALPTGSAGSFTTTQVERFYKPFTRLPSREFAADLAAFRPDVLFIPNFRLVLVSTWPQLLMVRNMEPLVWDDRTDPLRQRIVNRARRYEGRLATLRARRLIAVSQFVRDFLTRKWSVNDAKIGVVYHGTDAVDPGTAIRPTAVADGSEGAFFFTAGAIRPSRGLEDLLDALRLLRAEERSTLVVAGRADPMFESYERSLRGRYGDPWIVWAGGLSEAEMAWCYRNSAAMVMTSRVEACPNIGLEAMTYGCAIVAADNPPLPEIFGPTAVYYAPGAPDALVAQLRNIAARTPAQHVAASERARARSSEFSWQRTVEQTVDELQRTASLK